MTIKAIKKASELLLVGITNKEDIPKILLLIKNYSIGGVLLYKNAYDSLEELESLIDKLYKANKRNTTPLWIAIDEEGGRVNRLPKEFENLPTAYRLGKSTPDNISKASYTLCENLHNLGINMNLAPVLDLKLCDNSNGIGDRCYHSNYRKVCEIYDSLVPGYKKYKVMPVVKHFPGQGRLKNNSHKFFPVIKDYPNKDLTPFEHAIKTGCDALLLGHVIVKGETGLKPATLSKNFITKCIREECKYNGLIISDEIGMLPVRMFYGRINSVIKAVKAGNDVICIKYHKNNVEKVIKKLAKNIENGTLNIDDSYNRIIKTKEKYKLNDETYFDKINVDKYNRQIQKIKSVL